MTYEEFIQEIINNRGRHGCDEAYHEKHHIKPKCLGGEDKEENYIDLFAKEHFVAHRLLALENPQNKKLQYAWWCMVHKVDKNGKRYKCTAEEYEEAKIAFGKAMSEYRKGFEFSEDAKQKMSESHRGANNPNYGKPRLEETRKKISDAHNSSIVCVETGIVYQSGLEAYRQTGIYRSNICKCCKGIRHTAGGYHWKYKE